MFRNKEYVLTIFEEGGFSKAAERLYISQPSLSASVKRIEDKISVPLFDRSTTPVSLTEAGREYIRYALEIEERERDFERYVSDYTKLLTGTVIVGGSSMFSSFILPLEIWDFNQKYPDIKFEIIEDNTKNLLQKLSLGTLDIIIDNAIIKDDNISSAVYKSEILLLAVPIGFEINEKLKNYRMTAKDIKAGKHHSYGFGVGLKAFEDYPFILLKPENDTGKRAKSLFEKHDMNPEIIFCLEQQVTAYNISSTGMGISFVSDTLIKHIDSEPALYFYKISDKEISRNIYFYRKNNRYLSRACQEFIDFSSAK